MFGTLSYRASRRPQNGKNPYESSNQAFFRFRDTKPVDNIDIQDGLTVDLDDQKRLIGIEILDVSHRLPPDTLATITVQNLLTANP